MATRPTGLNTVDSLVRAQVAAAAAKVLTLPKLSSSSTTASHSNDMKVVKRSFSGKVGTGCTLFVAPPPEMSDDDVDVLLQKCPGLLGRELATDRSGRIVFGFFCSPDLAIAGIEKLQESDPPLYAELGERPVYPSEASNQNGDDVSLNKLEGNDIVQLPKPEVYPPHHTLRVACPNRSLGEMEEMLSQMSGVEDQRIDAKNIAWVRFSSVKTATAVLEYFSELKDDENWAHAKITYAKKLDDESSDGADDLRFSRERSRERHSSKRSSDGHEISRTQDKRQAPDEKRGKHSDSADRREFPSSPRGITPRDHRRNNTEDPRRRGNERRGARRQTEELSDENERRFSPRTGKPGHDRRRGRAEYSDIRK